MNPIQILLARLRLHVVPVGLALVALITGGLAANGTIQAHRLRTEVATLDASSRAMIVKIKGQQARIDAIQKFGANVDHSTTTIPCGHAIANATGTTSCSGAGFITGAHETFLESLATTSTDKAIVRYSGTSGATQNSTVTVSNAGLISGVADGSASTDVPAFHQIADAVNAQTFNGNVKVRAAANVGTLSGLAQTVDGVAINTDGDRVLADQQTTTTQDACYVAHAGAWTICPEMSTGSDAKHGTFLAESGTQAGIWADKQTTAQVVGTNDLTFSQIGSGGGAVSSVNGQTGAVVLGPKDVSSLQGIAVDAVTTVALPAYTAAGAGVGKTITLNSSAPCPTLGGLTPATSQALGSYATLLVQNGASFADNGPYSVTTSTGSSCVLTRDTRADTMLEILATPVHVIQGARRGAIYEYINDPAITLDTGMAAWGRVDVNRGPNEFWDITDDFVEAMNANGTATNGVTVPGPLSCLSSITATAIINIGGVVGTSTEPGILQLSTTNNTGVCSCTGPIGSRPIVISTPTWFRMRMRVAGPSSLSDGTVDVFRTLLGLGTGLGTTSTDGIFAEYTQATDTHWQSLVLNSSTPSRVASAVTVAVNTYTRVDFWKYAGETTLHSAFDGTELATGTWNNTTPLTVVLAQAKTGGTNTTVARTTNIDSYELTQQYPNGRSQ